MGALECAVALGCPPATAQCWGRDYADNRLAVLQQGNQGGPDRDIAHEVLGAVDGVDDPLTALKHSFAAEFFAENFIARALVRQNLAEQLLARDIGIGDRSQVGLGLDD